MINPINRVIYYHEFHVDDECMSSIMICDITVILCNVKMKFMKRKNGPVEAFSDFDQFFGNLPKYTITMSFILMICMRLLS